MKTLFGERKSVKTLAFILALALILPLLPVMSVVGAATEVTSITFTDATADNVENNPVFYWNQTGTVAINGSNGTVEGWERLGLQKIQASSDGEGIKVTKNGGGNITVFKFTVEKNNLSGDFAIQVSTEKSFTTGKTIELKPDKSGVYLINSEVFAALGLQSTGDIYVRAASVNTVTLPSFDSAKSSGYSLSKDENPVYGAQNTTDQSYSFKIKYNDTTAIPEVTAYTSNYQELNVTVSGTTAGERDVTINNITASITVSIILRPAVSISYSPAPGTVAESFKITGSGDLNSVPYGKQNFSFTVEAADGYTITGVTLGGQSIVTGSQDSADKKDCTISNAITKNLIVYITTEAVKPKVTLTAPTDDNEKALYTVSGIVAGENGITVSYGGSFTFSVTPKAGYDSLKVSYKMGTSGSETVITPNGNTYTINGITNDVTITIKPGDITKFGATLISDEHVSKVTDDEDAYKWEEENKTIEYNDSKTFKVKPNNGYKVTAIKVYAGNNLVIENTDSTSITVSNITSDLRVEVTTEPITITVNVSNGGNLNGTYVFKYGESGFEKEWINWAAEEGPAFQTENIANLIDQIKTLSGTSDVTRFGFEFDNSQDKGWFISAKTFSGKNADATITLAGNWKPVLTELFVLKTEVIYDPGLDTLSFVSRLVVSDSADDEAKAKYGSALVKVNSYGVFYGQYATSLNDDTTLLENVEKFIDDNKDKESMTQKDVKQNLWGNINKGQVYFYSTNRKLNPAEFQVSGNTITETFQENEQSSQRSGITWVEIEIEGYTDVIIGPATQYLGA